MKLEEAMSLLGLPPHAIPSPSQVKAAYKRKAWETHPDRFPAHEKAQAECRFKLCRSQKPTLPWALGEAEEEAQDLFQQVVWLRHSTFSIHLVRGLCFMYRAMIVNLITASYSWVVRTRVRKGAGAGQRNTRVASLPFFLIILGALTLGGSTAFRAYQRQKDDQTSYNPFLP
ncbi:DnaJ [Striga asiatica]|uniref:DnaJ n=1 Tax=Striga asiatica TaxID=4170 RepID=A0A5A7RCS2_STRAF|nr:DnaJ [Striga asiatica]